MYEGEFANGDLQNGKGVTHYEDGSFYTGGLSERKPQGLHRGRSVALGLHKHGRGKITFSEETSPRSLYFEAEFGYGSLNAGPGTYAWRNDIFVLDKSVIVELV